MSDGYSIALPSFSIILVVISQYELLPRKVGINICTLGVRYLSGCLVERERVGYRPKHNSHSTALTRFSLLSVRFIVPPYEGLSRKARNNVCSFGMRHVSGCLVVTSAVYPLAWWLN